MTASGRLSFLVMVCGASRLLCDFAPAVLGAQAASPPAQNTPSDDRPQLVWRTPGGDEARAYVEIQGVAATHLAAVARTERTREEWSSFLIVRVAGARASGDAPPLLGTYLVDGGVIRFRPRFPLEGGIVYRAEFDLGRLLAVVARGGSSSTAKAASAARGPARVLAAEFSPKGSSAAGGPATTVTAVYPSALVLPENLLRFYIHFSAPMSRGEAYHRIRLMDAGGKPVDAPFLELEEELWSSDGKRFTLLFDPGRVKKGLRPREEAGPILEAGKSYCLVIERGWHDASGNPLAAELRKPFRASHADEVSPDPKGWTARAPRAGTLGPLEVRFPESLDHALLNRLINVVDIAGQRVPGRIDVSERETVWHFTPAAEWHQGDYRLEVGADLEDVAGNSVARPFEVDIARPISRRITTDTVALPFRVEPAAHP